GGAPDRVRGGGRVQPAVLLLSGGHRPMPQAARARLAYPVAAPGTHRAPVGAQHGRSGQPAAAVLRRAGSVLSTVAWPARAVGAAVDPAATADRLGQLARWPPGGR